MPKEDAQPDLPAGTRRQSVNRLLAPLLALLLFAFGIAFSYKAAQGYAPYIGSYHDDGIYVACAKAIAGEKGYKIISLPMEPWQTKYPPLTSSTLAFAFRMIPKFPDNAFLIEGIACLNGVAFLLAAGALIVDSGRATPFLCLAVLAATWLNLNFLSYLPVPMAELQCGAIALVGLWLCERLQLNARKRRASGKPEPIVAWVMVGLVFVVASLAHVMGAFALLAALLYLVSQKNWKAALTVVLTWIVPVAPAGMWVAKNSFTTPPTLVYYTNYLLAAKSTAAQGALPVFVAKNLVSGFSEVMDTAIQAFKELIPEAEMQHTEYVVMYALAWLALLVGIARELFGRSPAKILSIWISLHGIAHLLWPRGVGMRRLLLALPFIYYFIFRGGRQVIYWLKPIFAHHLVQQAMIGIPLRLKYFSPVCAIGFAALLIGGDILEDWKFAGQYAYRVPPPPEAGKNYSEGSEFAEAYKWIESNTQESEVLVWNNDPAAYLWTGRKAMAASIGASFGVSIYPDALITKEDLLESMRLAHGNYLVIDPISVGGLVGFDQIGQAVEALMKERPGLLTMVFTSKYGLISIFKIDRSKL